MTPGRIWSVTYDNSMGYGGRVIPERFPIEAWPNSDDCPIPGAEKTNEKDYDTIKSLGIDSIFLCHSFFFK